MIFSSVFNTFKKDHDEDDETAGIMRSSRNHKDLPYDHEDRLYFDSPMKSSFSSITRKKYLEDDDDDVSSLDYNENETLERMKMDYEKNKMKLQNKTTTDSLRFDDIFGNGLNNINDETYSKRRNLIELNNKKFSRNVFGYMNDNTSSRDDSIYNLPNVYKETDKRRSNGYGSILDMNDMKNIQYTPQNSRGKHFNDINDNLDDKKRDLELENLELKHRIQQERMAKKVKEIEEREKYEKDKYMNLKRLEAEKENRILSDMKYKQEKDQMYDSLREYERSIERQTRMIDNQNNLIKNLEDKYSKLVTVVESQNEEMHNLKSGLETERSVSKRLNSRLELLNDRLSDTKQMLYSTKANISPSIKSKVRFDENYSNDASDISDFEYGETPTKFDLNNTEHILKLTERF